MHWNFFKSGTYVDQTETCVIQSMQLIAGSGNTLIVCNEALRYGHSAGFHAGYITRSIVVATTESSTDQGHVMHTAGGKFDVRYVRLERMGRTTTAMIDSTIMAPSTGYSFAVPNLARMNVTKYGVNQIGTYICFGVPVTRLCNAANVDLSFSFQPAMHFMPTTLSLRRTLLGTHCFTVPGMAVWPTTLVCTSSTMSSLEQMGLEYSWKMALKQDR